MKQWISGFVLLSVLVALDVPLALSQTVQIAYIDGVRIENGTRRAFEISEMLRQEFSAREQEVRGMEAKVKALQAQLPSIAAGRERELQTLGQRFEQAGRAFIDDLERRKAEERRKYFVEVTAIVNKIAETQKLDLVVQEAVYAGKAVDLTEQVIKALGGPAPKPAGK